MTAFNRSSFALGTAPIGLAPGPMLALLLAATWLLPAALLTALLIAVLIPYLLLSPSRANGAALRLALPFLLMVLWATANGTGNDLYVVLKDVWYGLKLCFCLMIGFLVGIRPIESGSTFRLLVLLAVFMAVASIFLGILSGATVGDLDVDNNYRVPLVALVAIVPLLDRFVRGPAGAGRAVAAAMLLTLLAAALLSNSRITLIASGVMVLSWAGLFSRTRRALLGGIVVLVVLTLLWSFLPEYQGGDLTVAVKLRRSLDEMLLTDNVDPTQVILNWRGFEAYNAQLLYDQGSIWRKLMGFGLGTTVDLGQEIPFEEGPLRFLPILHNGFYYLLIKYGLLGLAIYVLSVLRFGLLGKLNADNLSVEDRILRGLILVILLATSVITGLYNKTELNGIAILAAWLIGFAQRQLYERTVAGMLPVVVRA